MSGRVGTLGRGISLVYPYMRCVVPGCFIRTTKPTEYGMCPPWLWTEGHYRYYQRMKGAA